MCRENIGKQYFNTLSEFQNYVIHSPNYSIFAYTGGPPFTRILFTRIHYTRALKIPRKVRNSA